MEDVILLSQLNDFIFCPVSIYFHNLYGDMEKQLYQEKQQLAGTKAHETVDEKRYSTSKHIITGMDVFCEKYGIAGKIDIYNQKERVLIERKKKIQQVYDGYIFQLYGQYFALTEMGYDVSKLEMHSIDDNKTYSIPLPEEDPEMQSRFISTITSMRNFDMSKYVQENSKKCANCIYEPACDRTLKAQENTA